MKTKAFHLIRPVFSRFRRLCVGPLPSSALVLGTACLLAFSGSSHGQTTVNGAAGVDMGGRATTPRSGNISGLNTINFPSRTAGAVTWTNQHLSGFVVPAGQFTGTAMDGTNVAFPDLLPIRAQSLAVADSTDVTADVVQIDANGVTTGTLNLLDQTSVDSNDDPVTHAITIDNGELQLNGALLLGDFIEAPDDPTPGAIRYNSADADFEGYKGEDDGWVSLTFGSDGNDYYHSGNLGASVIEAALGLEDGDSLVTADASGNVDVSGELNARNLQVGDSNVIDEERLDQMIDLSKLLTSRDPEAVRDDWIVNANSGNVRKMVLDDSDNRYIAGTFNLMLTLGGTTLNAVGANDIFVAKVDSSGNVLWAKSFGGQSSDYVSALSVDGTGAVTLAGGFSSSDFAVSGLPNLSSAGSSDVFVLRLDNTGAAQWAKSFGGRSYDYVSALSVDSTGAVTLAGTFYGTDFAVNGLPKLRSAGGNDVFVLRLDTSGRAQWAKSFGGRSSENVRGLSVDSAGAVTLVGTFFGTDFAVNGLPNLRSAGSYDAFVLRLDKTGAAQWAKSFGGRSHENVSALSVDDAGSVTLAGNFSSTDFAVSGLPNLKSAGQQDVFVLRLDTSGAAQWAKSFGGRSADYVNALSVDSTGAVTLAGSFYSTDFAASGLPNLRSAGSNDAYVLRLDSSGTAQWAKSFGGRGYDTIGTVNTDSTGNVVFTGSSPGGTFGSRIGVGGLLYNFDPVWLAAWQGPDKPEQNNLALFGNEAAGKFSVAFGEANVAKGDTSFVWGKGNTASGSDSTVWGQKNIAESKYTTIWGLNNTGSGDYSTAWGVLNAIGGLASTAWGLSNKAESFLSTSFGQYNIGGYTFSDDNNDYNDGDKQWFDTDPLLEIGAGAPARYDPATRTQMAVTRANVLTLLKDGRIALGKHTTLDDLQTREETVQIEGALLLGDYAEAPDDPTPGAIRYNNTDADFQGYKGEDAGWVSLTTSDAETVQSASSLVVPGSTTAKLSVDANGRVLLAEAQGDIPMFGQ